MSKKKFREELGKNLEEFTGNPDPDQSVDLDTWFHCYFKSCDVMGLQPKKKILEEYEDYMAETERG